MEETELGDGKLAALISVSIPPDKSSHYSEEAAITALIGTKDAISFIPGLTLGQRCALGHPRVLRGWRKWRLL